MIPHMAEPRIIISDYSREDDETLAEACKNKDELAFQELMRRYIGQIFNFSRQYAHAQEDIDDIVQDTFFKVWRYIGRFKIGLRFKPWLFTIARNTALDHIKKKKASPFSDLDNAETETTFADSLSDPEPLPPELFERSALAAELVQALEILHPDHRAILILHYREHLTFEEIAKIVGHPMNTVKSWHRRALFRLRKELTHQNE